MILENNNNMNMPAEILLAALLLCSHRTLAAPPEVGTMSSSTVRLCPEKRSMGDGMPFYWKGEYHVFYLLNNSGNADIDWEHAVSKDLVHWLNLPAAILHDPADKTGPEGGCMFTGSIIEHNGTTSIPREVYEGPDGLLFMKPVPEVVNAFSESALSVSNIALEPGTAVTKEVPQDCLLEASVDMSKGREFGLSVRGDGIADACRIVLSADEKSLMTVGGQALESRPLPIDFTRPVAVQALILGGIAEVFVNSQYAATFFISPAGRTLGLESRGSVVVRSLQVKTKVVRKPL